MTSTCTSGKVSVAGSCIGGGGGGSDNTFSNLSTVYLTDNSTSFVNITDTEDHASYFIVVEPLILPGATATFAASSGSPGVAGSVARLTSSPSPTDEEIDVGWPADSSIQIQHSVVKSGGTADLIPYRVRIMGIL